MEAVRLVLTAREARTLSAIFERMFPSVAGEPGATEIGALAYVDQALSGTYAGKHDMYCRSLAALDRAAQSLYGAPFADCTDTRQDDLIRGLEQGSLPDFHTPRQQDFFELLLAHLQEGLFADPAYGGNREKLGWKVLGHPGVWLENSAEENLSSEPVTKGGKIQSLKDLGYTLDATEPAAPGIAGYDPQRGAAPPAAEVDVVIAGLGAMGGIMLLSWRTPACVSSRWRPVPGAPRRHSSPTNWARPTTAVPRWDPSSSLKSPAGGATRMSQHKRQPSRSAV